MSKYSIGPVSTMELIIRAKKDRMWVRAGKHWFMPEQFMDLFKDNRYHEFDDLPSFRVAMIDFILEAIV